ncbi:MAG: diaminopimelate epimerase [Phycisphaerales bacterium]|nr:MAG: diaminopimelate epimerase [Phycisphaerales bacterium]
MRFAKMHGLGNDYVYVDCFDHEVKDPAKLARVISDRHKGIGADGLILICPSEAADVRMRIFNADGSEAEMCGNGVRCVAKYAYEHGLSPAGKPLSVAGQAHDYPASLNIETAAGILTVGLLTDKRDRVQKVCVNMGRPILKPKDVPVNLPGERIVEHPIQVLGHELLMTCVSMGNPHAIFFCDDVSLVELERLGPAIEHDSLFPNRINVHFVQIDKPHQFTMRTWERGSGVTMACGTGACACCVAGVLAKNARRTCTAHLPGGNLELNWCAEDDCVYMTGPAVQVFEGIWPD